LLDTFFIGSHLASGTEYLLNRAAVH